MPDQGRAKGTKMPFFLVIEDVEEALAWLDPGERWTLFLQPLMAALAEERLGAVLEAESLVEEVEGRTIVVGDEIAMEVTDTGRAWELIRRIERQAGDAKEPPSIEQEGVGPA